MGTEIANSTSRTTATKIESSSAWPKSGSPGRVARNGITSAATPRKSSVAYSRLAAVEKWSVPWRMPPATRARPSTNRALPRTDPTSAAATTSTSPAWSAKTARNSSGRLPSVDWTTPVAAGLIRWASRSVASLTATAPPASASDREDEADERRQVQQVRDRDEDERRRVAAEDEPGAPVDPRHRLT